MKHLSETNINFNKVVAVPLPTHDTDAANKQYVDSLASQWAVFLAAHPIGSIFITTVATNPSTLYGGEWVAYAEGLTIVGKAPTGTFATAGAAVGAETAAPTNLYAKINVSDGGFLSYARKTVASWTRTHNQGIGGLVANANPFTEGTELGGTHTTVQPSIVTYMWRRTA